MGPAGRELQPQGTLDGAVLDWTGCTRPKASAASLVWPDTRTPILRGTGIIKKTKMGLWRATPWHRRQSLASDAVEDGLVFVPQHTGRRSLPHAFPASFNYQKFNSTFKNVGSHNCLPLSQANHNANHHLQGSSNST